MGVINYIEFGGVKSSDYGIYVSGEGTFNAPERDVELIEIPGRNGDFSLDKGRFKNITVTYPAFNYETNLTDFRTRLSDFRNALKSKLGYQRLEDTFHPDEYRMATFVDMIDVNPVMYNTASTIELTFNCKPQRFLKSGETEQEITSGGTITNPTLFEASPLLLLDGYGNIDIEGQNIAVSGEPLGRVNLVNPGTFQSRIVYCTFTEGNAAKLNTGDTITLAASSVSTRFDISAEWLPRFHIDSITQKSGGNQNITAELSIIGDGTGYYIALKLPSMTFQYGTEFEYYYTCNIEIFETTDDVQTNHVGSFYCRVNYDGAREIKTQFGGMSYWTNRGEYAHTISIGATTAESTKLVGNNIYIDLDLGEAYKIVDGAISSYNNIVSLPAKLPILKPGANTITYDDTITSLKITPRWWKI